MVLERVERVRPAGVGEAEPCGYFRWPDAARALAADQQTRDREHLGCTDGRLVTDRRDLEKQLAGNFLTAGAFGSSPLKGERA